MITVSNNARVAPTTRFRMERRGLTVSSGIRRTPTSSWSGRSLRLPSGNRLRAFMHRLPAAGVERHSRPEDSRTGWRAAAWNDEGHGYLTTARAPPGRRAGHDGRPAPRRAEAVRRADPRLAPGIPAGGDVRIGRRRAGRGGRGGGPAHPPAGRSGGGADVPGSLPGKREDGGGRLFRSAPAARDRVGPPPAAVAPDHVGPRSPRPRVKRHDP